MPNDNYLHDHRSPGRDPLDSLNMADQLDELFLAMNDQYSEQSFLRALDKLKRCDPSSYSAQENRVLSRLKTSGVDLSAEELEATMKDPSSITALLPDKKVLDVKMKDQLIETLCRLSSPRSLPKENFRRVLMHFSKRSDARQIKEGTVSAPFALLMRIMEQSEVNWKAAPSKNLTFQTRPLYTRLQLEIDSADEMAEYLSLSTTEQRKKFLMEQMDESILSLEDTPALRYYVCLITLQEMEARLKYMKRQKLPVPSSIFITPWKEQLENLLPSPSSDLFLLCSQLEAVLLEQPERRGEVCALVDSLSTAFRQFLADHNEKGVLAKYDKRISGWKDDFQILGFVEDVALSDFKPNRGLTLRYLYYLAFFFKVDYQDNAYGEYVSRDHELEHWVFYNLYNNTFLLNHPDLKTSDPKEAYGYGPNYKNYVQVCYLYWLYNWDKDPSLLPGQRIEKAEAMIAECERLAKQKTAPVAKLISSLKKQEALNEEISKIALQADALMDEFHSLHQVLEHTIQICHALLLQEMEDRHSISDQLLMKKLTHLLAVRSWKPKEARSIYEVLTTIIPAPEDYPEESKYLRKFKDSPDSLKESMVQIMDLYHKAYDKQEESFHILYGLDNTFSLPSADFSFKVPGSIALSDESPMGIINWLTALEEQADTMNQHIKSAQMVLRERSLALQKERSSLLALISDEHQPVSIHNTNRSHDYVQKEIFQKPYDQAVDNIVRAFSFETIPGSSAILIASSRMSASRMAAEILWKYTDFVDSSEETEDGGELFPQWKAPQKIYEWIGQRIEEAWHDLYETFDNESDKALAMDLVSRLAKKESVSVDEDNHKILCVLKEHGLPIVVDKQTASLSELPHTGKDRLFNMGFALLHEDVQRLYFLCGQLESLKEEADDWMIAANPMLIVFVLCILAYASQNQELLTQNQLIHQLKESSGLRISAPRLKQMISMLQELDFPIHTLKGRDHTNLYSIELPSQADPLKKPQSGYALLWEYRDLFTPDFLRGPRKKSSTRIKELGLKISEQLSVTRATVLVLLCDHLCFSSGRFAIENLDELLDDEREESDYYENMADFRLSVSVKLEDVSLQPFSEKSPLDLFVLLQYLCTLKSL